MNEKHLKLFTKVEEGLPETNMQCLCSDGIEIYYTEYYPELKRFGINNTKYWLDLSKLTTKLEAKKAMEETFDCGYFRGNIRNEEEFNSEKSNMVEIFYKTL